MAKVYAIHGAFSSPRIFNYLRYKIGSGFTWTYLDYQDITSGIQDIIANVTEQEYCHVIGHSMGGLIALALANQSWVKTVTTIATPIGGIDVNIFQSYITRSRFVTEIASHGDFISSLKSQKITKPVQHLITTVGFNPFIYEPNDGVVTVRSQKISSFGDTVEMAANHSEVMLDPKTAHCIRHFINQHLS
jgi:triacylglycerol esterase/lipase EstA (alpha/beta hydrolase family)